MMEIWKYRIEIEDDVQERMIPKGARIVVVGLEPNSGDPALWAEVDPSKGDEVRRFRVFGTGHLIPDGLEYVGTAIGHKDRFVWHVYEIKETDDGKVESVDS